MRIDGSQAPGAVGLDFEYASSYSRVSGVAVTSFSGGGVLVNASTTVTLDHDWIGVANSPIGGNAVVTGVYGNSPFGVEVGSFSRNDVLNDDVVSGNTYNGVVITGEAQTCTVENSMIGTDPTGRLTAASNGLSFGNGVSGGGGSGVVLNSATFDDTLSNNVIANNHDDGVSISGPYSGFNTLQDNKIGTDVNGWYSLPNHVGVVIGPGVQYTQVSGNQISGNSGDGIDLVGVATTSILNNYIGTSGYGYSTVGNGGAGVSLTQGANQNTVAGNQISGNGLDGVYMSDPGTSFNTIQGNLIGTDASGSYGLGNGRSGVFMINGPSNNVIGGTTAGARNVISGNGQDGVQIDYANSTGNIVEGNYIGTDATGT